MAKFVRFTEVWDKKSVWINADLVSHVKDAGEVEGNPSTYVNFYGDCRTVIGDPGTIIEKLEEARRG